MLRNFCCFSQAVVKTLPVLPCSPIRRVGDFPLREPRNFPAVYFPTSPFLRASVREPNKFTFRLRALSRNFYRGDIRVGRINENITIYRAAKAPCVYKFSIFSGRTVDRGMILEYLPPWARESSRPARPFSTSRLGKSSYLLPCTLSSTRVSHLI